MTYNKKALGPVISFLIWLLLLGIVCIIGITNVFAATYPISMTSEVAFYDNSGSSLTSIGTNWQESMQAYYSNNLPTTAGSYGGAIAFNSPIPLLANHTYALTLTFDNDDIDIALSLKNKIAIGNSISSVKYNYEQGNYYNELVYSNVANKSTLQFSFKTASNGNASYILIPWTTKTNMNKVYYFNQIIIDDLGTTSVTQDQINSSLNNQTNEINNSISNSETNIKNEIKNTEENIKDGIKEGFESCRDSYNILQLTPTVSGIANIKSDGSIVLDGTISQAYSITITRYSYTSGDYYFSFNSTGDLNGTYFVFRYSDTYYLFNNDQTFNLSQNYSSYMSLVIMPGTYSNVVIKPMIEKGTIKHSFEPYGQTICSNRIDDTNKKLDEQNETSKGILGKIKDLFNWLTNKDDADVSSAGNVAGWLPAGPVDSLITLPLTFLQNVNSSLSKTCSPLSVTLPYVKENVEIPCLNTIFNQITGLPSFWNWVGTIASVVILFRYLLAFYDYFDKLTTMKANFISDWGGI